MVKHPSALAIAAAALTFTAAQAQAQQPLAFVTCPILRDTATVPCWLAEHRGELYFLVTQEDGSAGVYPPSLGHQALIEGTPTEARRCGGKVLTNLRISIRPERDLSCDTILPATDAFQIAAQPLGPGAGDAQPAPRSAAPRSGALPATPGSLSRQFEVLYDFDWQTAGRESAILQEAAAYAQANPMGLVRVQGYRASVMLADRKVLEEAEGIDLRRARELVDTLTTLGLKEILVIDNPEAELGDHTRRRAVIEVVFSGSPDDHSEH